MKLIILESENVIIQSCAHGWLEEARTNGLRALGPCKIRTRLPIGVMFLLDSRWKTKTHGAPDLYKTLEFFR